jgi:hypothetical protein
VLCHCPSVILLGNDSSLVRRRDRAFPDLTDWLAKASEPGRTTTLKRSSLGLGLRWHGAVSNSCRGSLYVSVPALAQRPVGSCIDNLSRRRTAKLQFTLRWLMRRYTSLQHIRRAPREQSLGSSRATLSPRRILWICDPVWRSPPSILGARILRRLLLLLSFTARDTFAEAD